MAVALPGFVRLLLILVGALTIGCAAGRPEHRTVTTTPVDRMQWLEAAVARADNIVEVMRGAYVPRGTPGAAIVCSLAIQIDAWYGVGDERWEWTAANGDVMEESSDSMRPARRTTNIREELARIGIRDCVLDVDR